MMTQELMWVCAIAPEEFRERTTRLCLSKNKDIGLPENVFKLPLHISLKKSFRTDSFEAVKKDILQILEKTGRFRCRIDKVELHREMLWLSLINDGKLRLVHEELDRLLEMRHRIPAGKYDHTFRPHISLFTRGAPEEMRTMYGKLKDLDFGGEIEISRFVVGSSAHKDTFFDL